MAKKPRDKDKVRKTRSAPTPNSGPVSYDLWLLVDKDWQGPQTLRGKNRRTVAREVGAKHPSGTWKLRLA